MPTPMLSAGVSPFERARATKACLIAALVASLVSLPAAASLADALSVIVVGPDAGTSAQMTERVGGEVTHHLPIIDAVSARIPASGLGFLQRHALVVDDRAVSLTASAYDGGPVTAYPYEVGAVRARADGATGEGVTVALIDTGVAHVPDLAERVVATANFTRERSHEDTYGHGTFQAGLIAGDGTASDGAYTGVAPGAGLLSVKVADASGSTSLSQVLAGVQLVDDSIERFNVRVALLAIDSESPLPPDLDPLSWALRTLWSHGVVVVVPAGNDGPDHETIASPGEDPWLLTVGSVDDRGTPDVDDDLVAEHSSRGPTRWGADKPEVAAPGEHLVSVRAPGSTVDAQNPNARVDGAYFRGSGTSMSAAVTAGAAALVLGERPGLSPDEVKALLQATAAGIADGSADATGAGVVNAADAIGSEVVTDLPAHPDLDPIDIHLPPGHDFGWERDDSGVWRWDSRPRGRRGGASEDEFEARQWRARQWAARQWLVKTWQARQWMARQWAARQWVARQWAARQWKARQWKDERWAARQWAARQWKARQWKDEDWAARQWNARQWSEDEWLARQWNARQWNARQWNDHQWSADGWSARQWSARQWSSGAWG